MNKKLVTDIETLVTVRARIAWLENEVEELVLDKEHLQKQIIRGVTEYNTLREAVQKIIKTLDESGPGSQCPKCGQPLIDNAIQCLQYIIDGNEGGSCPPNAKPSTQFGKCLQNPKLPTRSSDTFTASTSEDALESYCRYCGGTGRKPFYGRCPDCRGTGGAKPAGDCELCGGRGELGNEDCPDCNGTGKAKRSGTSNASTGKQEPKE